MRKADGAHSDVRLCAGPVVTHRNTQARRLTAAGYECIKDLWVPAAFAKRAREQAEMHRADVERIASEGKRRGRPPKSETP